MTLNVFYKHQRLEGILFFFFLKHMRIADNTAGRDKLSQDAISWLFPKAPRKVATPAITSATPATAPAPTHTPLHRVCYIIRER